MKVKNSKVFVGDFETTVYAGQQDTEVWASAVVELNKNYVLIHHSIEETYEYLTQQNCNVTIYYHNLKFDGAFWLDLLIRKLKYNQAYTIENGNYKTIKWVKDHEMKNNSFKYLVADNGMFYMITIKHGGHYITIKDSYKLLPFSLERIGESFKTKHRKLDMKYEGFRYAGCEITQEEQDYIRNDVLVIKEALEIMYAQGHKKLTIGSCCLHEFRQIMKYDWDLLFPNLKEYEIDEQTYGSPNADSYIRKSYKGGWCYVNPKYQSKVIKGGVTLDVNSLYPSVMSDPNNYYPVGLPHFWVGDRPMRTYGYDDTGTYVGEVYYFIRIKVKFRIKKGYLPFIQVKNSYLYAKNEALTTSNYIDKEGKEHEYLIDENGNKNPCLITLTLSKTDYELFLKHYDVEYMTVMDGCWFNQENTWIFSKYIEKYKKIKMESTGAVRELAKLFLNNLYGKLSTADNSSFKVAYLDEETEAVKYFTVPQFDKKVVYIPCGSAVTSYARRFTIKSAQENYDRFIYADTDSIHCKGTIDDIKNVTIHDTEFNCWKHESTWDIGYFTRQKTYIEHTESGYDIKCAGMPQRCKKLFEHSLSGRYTKEITPELQEELNELSPEAQEFVKKKRTLKDFDIGLKIPDKLIPRRIKGGIVLEKTTFEMR